MHGPLAGFCVRCGGGAVCREGRAAADRTYNRTVVSPGHAPDRSEPEDKEPRDTLRRRRSLLGCVYETTQCHRAGLLFRHRKV